MCNEVRRQIALGQVATGWGETRITLRFPEGRPNMAPLESVRITDPTVIIRASSDDLEEEEKQSFDCAQDERGGDGSSRAAEFGERSAPGTPLSAELVTRRWSWLGAGGRPVYNFRSDGRDLREGRCLVPVDGFYEFTAPADPAKKRKDKWLFTWEGAGIEGDWFCIAGLWRRDPKVGEAFTLLTTEPGPDVAPYHGRQIVLLPRKSWARWLDPAVPAADLIRPLPAGTLTVRQVG